MSNKKEAPLTKRDETLIYIADEIRFLDIVMIHPALTYTIDTDLKSDLYCVKDNRLYNPLLWRDPFEYYDIFYEHIKKAIEEVKGTILMVYNSSLAICTSQFHELFEKWKRNPVSCLYFFNSDEDLAAAYPECADDLVADSNAVYNDVALYPHIRKIEVPVDFKISLRGLLAVNYGEYANYVGDLRFTVNHSAV